MKRHGTKFLTALALLLILVTAHAGKVPYVPVILAGAIVAVAVGVLS